MSEQNKLVKIAKYRDEEIRVELEPNNCWVKLVKGDKSLRLEFTRESREE